MLVTASERRKIVVLSGDRRVDAAIPLDDTLGESLRALGYTLEPGRHVVLERSGNETSLDAVGDDILVEAVTSAGYSFSHGLDTDWAFSRV